MRLFAVGGGCLRSGQLQVRRKCSGHANHPRVVATRTGHAATAVQRCRIRAGAGLHWADGDRHVRTGKRGTFKEQAPDRCPLRRRESSAEAAPVKQAVEEVDLPRWPQMTWAGEAARARGAQPRRQGDPAQEVKVRACDAQHPSLEADGPQPAAPLDVGAPLARPAVSQLDDEALVAEENLPKGFARGDEAQHPSGQATKLAGTKKWLLYMEPHHGLFDARRRPVPGTEATGCLERTSPAPATPLLKKPPGSGPKPARQTRQVAAAEILELHRQPQHCADGALNGATVETHQGPKQTGEKVDAQTADVQARRSHASSIAEARHQARKTPRASIARNRETPWRAC